MEKSKKAKIRRIAIWLVLILLVIGGWIFSFKLDFSHGKKPVFGVTFSQLYAQDLGLDWQKTYRAILDDLHVRDLRLVAYWDEIESTQDTFNYADLDWQMNLALARNARVILVVGRRVPRWPECHDPAWLKNLAPLAVQQQQLAFVRRTVMRYAQSPAITAWQVENEPLFGLFGNCPPPSKQFLSDEVALVRQLDSRPIIITDSGELGTWQGAASITDSLGITLYRIVWNQYFGFWDYWFVPPVAYRIKAAVTSFFHPNLQNIMVTELQMEPWTQGKRMVELTTAQQEQSFTLQRFKDNISYTIKTGFSPVYLWGVEYWYWLAEHGRPEMWQQAKLLWQ